MLVKDWGRMFLDLGDKQSLLSSLKESQFYRAFESIGKWSNIAYAIPHTIANSGASYETKMSNLDFVLHALNTVQRKWGIGDTMAKEICEKVGIPAERRVNELSDADVIQIRETIDADYMVEGDLRRDTSMNIKRLLDMGIYRGLRHRRNLPVRGQRTHTNARTRKGPAKAIAGKKQ